MTVTSILSFFFPLFLSSSLLVTSDERMKKKPRAKENDCKLDSWLLHKGKENRTREYTLGMTDIQHKREERNRIKIRTLVSRSCEIDVEMKRKKNENLKHIIATIMFVRIREKKSVSRLKIKIKERIY